MSVCPLSTLDIKPKNFGSIAIAYLNEIDRPEKYVFYNINDNILEEGHRTELKAYKGVMVSRDNPEKDMFKINLLNMLQK